MQTMKARIILVAALAVLVALPAGVQAQKKGKKQAEKNVLTLHIENASDDTVYMGNYYAKGTYATDTALNDGKGNYVFKRMTDSIFSPTRRENMWSLWCMAARNRHSSLPPTTRTGRRL